MRRGPCAEGERRSRPKKTSEVDEATDKTTVAHRHRDVCEHLSRFAGLDTDLASILQLRRVRHVVHDISMR